MNNSIGRAFWAVLVFLSAAGVAAAQSVERIDVLDSGLYNAVTTRTEAAPGTASGRTHVVDKVEFYARTNRVPARIGTRFGMRYVVVGSPQDQNVGVRVVWKLPAPGLRNPKTGNVYRETNEDVTKTIGYRDSLTGYRFDDDWELVPGDWTLELWAGGRMLATRTYTVYRP